MHRTNYGSNDKWAATWDSQQCGMCDQQSLRSACAYAQSDQSLCLSLEYSMTVRLLTEQHLEFLSLIRGCTGSSEYTLVKMTHCWKSHVTAQIINQQQQNHLLRTVSEALNAFYWSQIFALDSAIVKTQNKMVSLQRGFLTYAMHHRRETI